MTQRIMRDTCVDHQHRHRGRGRPRRLSCSTTGAATPPAMPRQPPARRRARRPARGAARPPMPVEFAAVKRAPVAEQVLVVGNLIGAATVEVVPRSTAGCRRSTSSSATRSGEGQVDRASVEDREIREQVRQAEASYKVAQATIRQREADLKLAQTNLDRIAQPVRAPAAAAADVRRRRRAAPGGGGAARSRARAVRAGEVAARRAEDHAREHPVISSPVDGFIGKRFLDPGAFASTNAPVASVVDIRTVRMVANLVETDMRARAGRHAGAASKSTRSRARTSRPRQPRRAGVRPGDAHRGDGNRSAERRATA